MGFRAVIRNRGLSGRCHVMSSELPTRPDDTVPTRDNTPRRYVPIYGREYAQKVRSRASDERTAQRIPHEMLSRSTTRARHGRRYEFCEHTVNADPS